MEENKFVREQFVIKNKDIAKLLETFGSNDVDEVNELKNKINLLTEENNIILKHLNEMKVLINLLLIIYKFLFYKIII